MGISEFSIHNVLRTYTRQERLGQVNKPKPGARQAAPRSLDQVTLSPTARKAQWVGQLAAEVVDRGQAGLTPEERSVRIRDVKDELLSRHGDEAADESLSPEGFEAQLRQLYLG